MEAEVKGLKQKDYEVRARVMKALAHPSRLLMVDALGRREQCVCELTELVGADISTVSKHLSILKDAEIVTSDKRGLQVFYRLKCTCIPQFFECVESVLKQQAGSPCCSTAER